MNWQTQQPDLFYPYETTPQGPYDRMSSLERDYCSNFTCCGLHLSDLHSLLEHFEDAHVVVVDTAGDLVFPRSISPSLSEPPSPILRHHTNTSVSENSNGYAQDTYRYSPDTSASSLFYPCHDYPPVDQPSSYHPTSYAYYYPFSPPEQPQSPQLQPQLYSHGLRSHSGSEINYALVESPTPSASYPQRTFLREFWKDSPFEFDAYPHSPLTDASPSLDSSSSATSSPRSEDAECGGLPPSSFVVDRSLSLSPSIQHMHRSRGSVTGVVAKCKARANTRNTRARPYVRKREKMHKCPTPGCSKSYLNPNGLKYHIEKGTCKIEPPHPQSERGVSRGVIH